MATPRIGYTRELTSSMRTFLEAIRPEVSLFPAALTLTPMSVASLVCASPTAMVHNNNNGNSHVPTGVEGRKQGNTMVANNGMLSTNQGNTTAAAVQNKTGLLSTHQHTSSHSVAQNLPTSSGNRGATGDAFNSNGTQRLPSISTLQVPPIHMTSLSVPAPFPNNAAPTTTSAVNNTMNTTITTTSANGQLTSLQQQQQQNQQQQQLLQQQMQLQMQQFQQMYPYMPNFMMPGANMKMPTTQEEFLVYQQQMQFQQFLQQQQYQMFLQQQQLMNQQMNPNGETNNNTIGANSSIPLQMQQMQLQQQQLFAQQMQNMNPNISNILLPAHATATSIATSITPAGSATSTANLSTNGSSAINASTNATSNTSTTNSANTTERGQPNHSALTSNTNNNANNSNNTSSTNKRTRRIRPDLVSVDPELRSPSSSLQGLLQDKDNRTSSNNNHSKGNKSSSLSAEDAQASRSVSFLLNRDASTPDVSLSQFHDLYQNQHLSSNQDSIFSLLCPGDNSIPFGESLSIPYLESSEHSSSSSNEPFPALATTQKQSQPDSGAKSSQNGPVSATTHGSKVSTTTVPEAGPTLKGILSKHPKKKTIKPMLISAATATAGATVSNVFDAPSSANHTRSANTSTTAKKATSGAGTNSRNNVPSTLLKNNNNNNNHNNNNQGNATSMSSLYGDVSLSGLEGLSCLQWGDASQAAYDSYSASNSASASNSNSSGMDDTRLSAFGASILPEMSLMDASRFSFSNFAPPRFDSYSDESNLQANDNNNNSRASKSNSKSGSKSTAKKTTMASKNTEDSQSASRSDSKSGSKSSNKSNASNKKNSSSSANAASSNNNSQSKTTSSSASAGASRTAAAQMSSFGSPLRGLGSPLRTMYTRSALASPAAAGAADLYPFDETSNMSLLGDLFGDGDFSTHPSTNNGAAGDNILLSPLRSHSKPPLHASWNSPQAQRRQSSAPDASVQSNSNTAGKKRPHSAVNNSARASGDPARPFQNISARPGIATQPAAAQHSTHLLNGHGGSRGIGPSPKKQKKAGGLFAEVMAKSQR